MSINHYYSSDLPEAHWWSPYMMDSPAKTSSSSPQHHKSHSHLNLFHSSTTTHHRPTTATMFQNAAAAVAFSFNLNNEDPDEELLDNNSTTTSSSRERQLLGQEEEEIPKEPLFEKPLTPSDVGKLNRLVIPKQHAEKYFPLNGSGGGDSGEKGFLLGFEDEVGKSWRFRYSYWNSSQSYVLTKGWSRFVKEKRLDAGDIVLFGRHRDDGGRLFIGWRRRNSDSDGGTAAVNNTTTASGGGGGWGMAVAHSSSRHHQHRSSNYQAQLPYQPESCLHAGSVVSQNQTATAGSSGNSKRLRLFGVNLDFPAESSEPSTPDDSPVSQPHPYLHQYYSNHHNHMDINFSGGGDVYRQG